MFLVVLLRRGEFFHRPEQGTGASPAAEGEDSSDVGLAVFGFAAQRVEQHVGIREACIVPRHPLDDVMLHIGCGDAFRRLFHPQDLFAESPVPIQDALPDGPNVIRRGVGRIVEHHRIVDIEPRDAPGYAAGDRLDLPFGFKVAQVTGVRGLQFLAFKRARPVGGQEVAHFVAGLEVLIRLAVARLNALPDDETASLLAGSGQAF